MLMTTRRRGRRKMQLKVAESDLDDEIEECGKHFVKYFQSMSNDLKRLMRYSPAKRISEKLRNVCVYVWLAQSANMKSSRVFPSVTVKFRFLSPFLFLICRSQKYFLLLVIRECVENKISMSRTAEEKVNFWQISSWRAHFCRQFEFNSVTRKLLQLCSKCNIEKMSSDRTIHDVIMVLNIADKQWTLMKEFALMSKWSRNLKLRNEKIEVRSHFERTFRI